MNIGVYCIKDVVANDSMSPVCFRSHKEAIRGFKNQMAKMAKDGGFDPVDFELCYLGTFDTSVPTLQGIRARDVRLAYYDANGNLVSLAEECDE